MFLFHSLVIISGNACERGEKKKGAGDTEGKWEGVYVEFIIVYLIFPVRFAHFIHNIDLRSKCFYLYYID